MFLHVQLETENTRKMSSDVCVVVGVCARSLVTGLRDR